MEAQRRILLVDDEPALLRMMRTTLDRAGWASEEAADGAEAIRRVGTTSFDAVVSDVQMPNCSGVEMLQRIREHDCDVPVLLLTGQPTIESSSRAVEHGAFRYLLKPVLPSALREALTEAMHHHDLAKARRRAVDAQGGEANLLEEHAALSARFSRAIEGLWVAFQPIVSWKERRVFGYEGLLRTTEPTLASPPAFLEVAERLGRMRDLGRAVRATAARTPPPDGAKMFVNLHSSDLSDDELFAADAPLSAIAKNVVLEITERASLEQVDDVAARITRLRAMGFQVAIDDLGAGYAGLSTFTELGPEIAKLDMSLVRNVDSEPRKQRVVRSMRDLCAQLGILVVAEGVETAAERDTLVELGCDVFQGYLFAKPGKPFPAPKWA